MRLIFYVISVELLHIHQKKPWKKKYLRPVLFRQVQGETVCTFIHDQRLLSSAMALLSTPGKSHHTSTSPHTLKLPWTQNHPQRSSRATHKSSWRMYNTSLVYWYQPAWLRWSLSEPIPLIPWIVAVSRGGKTAGICILTQKFIHVEVHVGGCSCQDHTQPIHIKCDGKCENSTMLPLGLGIFPPKSWRWG